MDMRPPEARLSPFTCTRNDLLTAVAAIRDELKENFLPDVARAVRDDLQETLGKSLTTSLASQGDELVGKLVGLVKREVEREVSRTVGAVLKGMAQKHEEEMAALRKAHVEGLRLVKSLLDNLPAPQVNVPAEAIQVQVAQEPPRVIVPEGAIRVDVKQEPSQVTVQVPEQPPAVVNVEAPKPRSVTKSITYDEYGRPAIITEAENKE